MSETKTFKNVTISDGGKGITIYTRSGASGDWGRSPLETFLHEEWDVEVTFTRKPRQVVVGDRVKHYNHPEVGNILAIRYISSGVLAGNHWAWVSWDTSAIPNSVLLSKLRHADEENDV